jgi:hypothetical protein
LTKNNNLPRILDILSGIINNQFRPTKVSVPCTNKTHELASNDIIADIRSARVRTRKKYDRGELPIFVVLGGCSNKLSVSPF